MCVAKIKNNKQTQMATVFKISTKHFYGEHLNYNAQRVYKMTKNNKIFFNNQVCFKITG